jgi:hypothetical protein
MNDLALRWRTHNPTICGFRSMLLPKIAIISLPFQVEQPMRDCAKTRQVAHFEIVTGFEKMELEACLDWKSEALSN